MPTKPARHEAGHVVAGIFHGCPVRYATTIPSGKTCLTLPAIPAGDVTSAYKQAFAVCQAGMAATHDDQPSWQDISELSGYTEVYLKHFGATRLARQEQLMGVQLWTWVHDEHISQAINAVATALDSRKYLSGAQAEAIAEPHLARYHKRRQAAQAASLLAEASMLTALAQQTAGVQAFPTLFAAESVWLTGVLGALQGQGDAPPHLQAAQVHQRPPYTRVPGENGDIALIGLSGVLTKTPSIFSTLLGGTPTLPVRAALRQAVSDPTIKSVLLAIDSGGGSVDGTGDLADDVHRLGATKPVYTFANGLMASAAFWIGSQSTSISASPTSEIGSVGTIILLRDSSALHQRMGVRVLPITSAPYKTVGIDGVAVDDTATDYLQHRVTQMNQHFLSAVARGRRTSVARVQRDWGDGKVHLSSTSVDLGMIDRVESFESMLTRLATGKG